MKSTKSITLLILFMLLQVAVKAQEVNYIYDASGNRIHRTLTAKKLADPPQKTTKDSIITIADDINNIIAAEELSKEKGESGEEANGIDELTAEDIKVFPNPVQYKLNVQFNGTATANGCSLQLYDGTGRLFYKDASPKNQTEVDMQQAKAGNYYLVVLTKEGKKAVLESGEGVRRIKVKVERLKVKVESGKVGSDKWEICGYLCAFCNLLYYYCLLRSSD